MELIVDDIETAAREAVDQLGVSVDMVDADKLPTLKQLALACRRLGLDAPAELERALDA